MYIRAAASISPQASFEQMLVQPAMSGSNRLYCAEPDYTKLIDAKMIRRMSRIIKMGVAAAMDCLNKANEKMPDAIITGTAYGCLADTEVFLSRMVENKESLLTPTAFIQSTHNTVGAQIALLLKCHQYNNTFVHRGFSFESALLDAITLLKEQQWSTALVGGVDEITNTSHVILSRFGLYKNEPVDGAHMFDQASRGTIAGEGASFFLLGQQPSGKDYAQLRAVETFYKPKSFAQVKQHIESFLASQNITPGEIDVLITGENGDVQNDRLYIPLHQSVFAGIQQQVRFKQWCGEYPTATAFALWLAANMLQSGKVPAYIKTAAEPKTILIYNHYQQIHHSLYLVAAC